MSITMSALWAGIILSWNGKITAVIPKSSNYCSNYSSNSNNIFPNVNCRIVDDIDIKKLHLKIS